VSEDRRSLNHDNQGISDNSEPRDQSTGSPGESSQGELEEVVRKLSSLPEGEARSTIAELFEDPEHKDAIATIAAASISGSWSGLLPDPDSFNQYPEWVQEKMCGWNDAFTVDESKRQDNLVSAIINDTKKVTTWSIVFIGAIIFGGLALFLFENNVGGGIMIGAGVLASLNSTLQKLLTNLGNSRAKN